MGLGKQIAYRMPELKNKMKMAGMTISAEAYLDKVVRQAILAAAMFGILSFMLVQKSGGSMLTVVAVTVLGFVIVYSTFLKQVDSKISNKAKEIDKDVLFAGRFLLVKLNSGQPLLNALTDASKSYGVANQVFKDMLHDIDLGTPLEEALDKATKYTPSNKMHRILFQINNALQIGIDVTNTLEAVLEEIANEQLIEIQRYGKKLNSFTMFYMLLAVVLPSLGMTLFIVVASLTSIQVGGLFYFTLGFFFLIVQIVFILLFKSIRPSVNV